MGIGVFNVSKIRIQSSSRRDPGVPPWGGGGSYPSCKHSAGSLNRITRCLCSESRCNHLGLLLDQYAKFEFKYTVYLLFFWEIGSFFSEINFRGRRDMGECDWCPSRGAPGPRMAAAAALSRMAAAAAAAAAAEIFAVAMFMIWWIIIKIETINMRGRGYCFSNHLFVCLFLPVAIAVRSSKTLSCCCLLGGNFFNTTKGLPSLKS